MINNLELFAGAGGLAIGMANAGFTHKALIEWDEHACKTFQQNHTVLSHLDDELPIYQADALKFDYTPYARRVDVVSGGPPCQPFSMGGKHLAHRDRRDMFPAAIRAVRDIHPRAFIFENVKGLTRDSFKTYFSYLLLQLQYPSLQRKRGEQWTKHLSKLERHHTATRHASEYKVLFRVLNAADFGVPQRRHRVFFVGFRSDLGVEWSFPLPTHSERVLSIEKWVTGAYWEQHAVPKRERSTAAPSDLKRVVVRNEDWFDPSGAKLMRWQTVRDALRDLPLPSLVGDSKVLNHVLIPGARAYAGHTGSALDEPAKTLKAGDHGVPGGENMLCLSTGDVRYFTVREAARIQTFPDSYVFSGTWTQTMRQLGNAVPVLLAESVARSVARQLQGAGRAK